MKRPLLTLLAFCAVLALRAPLAAESGCPLKVVGRVEQEGLKVIVTVTNRSEEDAVRLHSLVVTYSDFIGTYYEKVYRYNVLIQPLQTLRLRTPILDGVPNYQTVAASARCAKRGDERE